MLKTLDILNYALFKIKRSVWNIQGPKTLVCKDIGTRKSEFVAKTQCLCYFVLNLAQLCSSFKCLFSNKINRIKVVYAVSCNFVI